MFKKLRQAITNITIGEPRFIVIVAREWWSLVANELAEELRQSEKIDVEVTLANTFEVSNGGEIIDLRSAEFSQKIATVTYYEKNYLIDRLDCNSLEKRYGFDIETLKNLVHSGSLSDSELKDVLDLLKLKRELNALAIETMKSEMDEMN